MRFKLAIAIFLVISLQSCTNVFYLPAKEEVMNPGEIGIKYEDVWIENEGEPKLHAWFLPAENPIATVLHLHGNAENISTHFSNVFWMPRQGISVLCLDYRGYGLSEGDVAIEGIHKDIERATHYLQNRPDINKNKLILFGQSLGGTMALYSAAQPELHDAFRLVIAESAFSGYRDIAQEKLASTWLTYPFQWFLPFLVTDQYSALKFVKQIAPTPVLLIHGERDEIVSTENSERLCKELGENCNIWRIKRGGHINALRDPKLQVDLIDLIRQSITNESTKFQ